jgi:hypothetical protein
MSAGNAKTDGLRSGLGIWVFCTTMPLRESRDLQHARPMNAGKGKEDGP